MRLDEDEERQPNQAFRPCTLEITNMPLWTPSGTENQLRDSFFKQHTDETPGWHGAVNVLELLSITHAYLVASELSVMNLRPL